MSPLPLAVAVVLLVVLRLGLPWAAPLSPLLGVPMPKPLGVGMILECLFSCETRAATGKCAARAAALHTVAVSGHRLLLGLCSWLAPVLAPVQGTQLHRTSVVPSVVPCGLSCDSVSRTLNARLSRVCCVALLCGKSEATGIPVATGYLKCLDAIPSLVSTFPLLSVRPHFGSHRSTRHGAHRNALT